MLKRSSQRTFTERAAALGVSLLYRSGDGYYELPQFGGTQIWLATLDDPDKLRGPNLAFFAVDEASYAAEASWLQLEARLRDPLATEKAGIGAWTPKGWNWLYRKFIKQEKPDSNYQAVLANPMENTYLDADYYPGLMRSYSPNFAKQEVLGHYLNVFSGRAYDSFSSEAEGNIWHANGQENYSGFLSCAYRKDRPILWSCDWNISPATSVICQSVSLVPTPSNPFAARGPDPRVGGAEKQLNVLDELYLPDTNTEQHCEAFYEKIRPKLMPGRKLHVIGYGDASGERRQSSSSESDYAIIRRFFSRHASEFQFELRVPSANPLVKDRINAVNAMACNYNGVRRLAVHERCKMLIRDLEEVSWAMDGNENMLPTLSTKNKVLTHVSDALGYLIHFEWPIKGTIGYKSGFIG
jgi:hypothetical protein